MYVDYQLYYSNISVSNACCDADECDELFRRIVQYSIVVGAAVDTPSRYGNTDIEL